MKQPFGGTPRTIVATGEVFEPRRLTPEIQETILATIDRRPGGANSGEIAKALGLNIPAASPFLEELADRGMILSQHSMGRTTWLRRTVDYDEDMVDEDHVPAIRNFLLGRREMAGAIARGTGLPLAEVRATCEWMLQQGMLTGRPVGASMVYGTDDVLSLGTTETVPVSPDALFAQQLARIRSDDRVRITRAWEDREAELERKRRQREQEKAERERERLEQKAERERVRAEQKAERDAERRERQAAARSTSRARKSVTQAQREQVRQQREASRLRRGQEFQERALGRAAQQAPANPLPEARLEYARRIFAGLFPDWSSETPSAQVEETLGLVRGALRGWLTKRPAVLALCRHDGYRLFVPAEAVIQYLASVTPAGVEFRTEVPEGWIDVPAAERDGWTRKRLNHAIEKGLVRVVYARGRLRLDPEALAAVARQPGLAPGVPEGWVAVVELARESGRDPSTLAGWLRDRGHEIRIYRGWDGHRLGFVEPGSAQAAREYYGPDGVNRQPRGTAQRAQMIPRAHTPQPTRTFANARRGRLSARTRRLLEYLSEPHGVPDVAAHFQMDPGSAWDLVKAAVERGYLERCGVGTYRQTKDGARVLRPVKRNRSSLPGRVPPPPPPVDGKRWSPERETWLAEHYARLGHHGAAPLLGVKPHTVWAKADRMGLRGRAAPGYTLIQDVALEIAGMHGMDPGAIYSSIWARAKHAGVMKYADGDLNKRKRRPMIPQEWARTVVAERTPPAATDMSLRELLDRTDLSRSQAVRKVHPYYLRTETGGQPEIFFPRERGETLIAARATRAPVHAPGKAGLLAALEQAGAAGLTEGELLAALGVSRAAVRIHTRQLGQQDPSPLQRCRGSSSTDPIVWRLSRFAQEPDPPQRPVDRSRWGKHWKEKREAREQKKAPLPSPVPEPAPKPAPKPITSEIARALRAELPPERRRIPGETARVAAKYGLSVLQVRRELSYILKEPT